MSAEQDQVVSFEVGVRYADGEVYCYGSDEAAERRSKYLAARYAGSEIVRRTVVRSAWEQSNREALEQCVKRAT